MNRKLQMLPLTRKLVFLHAAACERSSAPHIHASLAEKSAAGVPQHILLSRKMSNSPRGFERGCAKEEEEGVQKPDCLHWKRAQKLNCKLFP